MLLVLVALALLPDEARAGTIVVSTDGTLRTAIENAVNGDTILFNQDITLLSELPAVQANITIDGADFWLNGSSTYRCLFVGAWTPGTATQVAVNVAIENLEFLSCKAQGGTGGSAIARGGGGAGLGGGLFVSDLATVTLTNVRFANDNATGGAGGPDGGGFSGGGGGGMGGNGGSGSENFEDANGGGGGGLGLTAVGGTFTGNGGAGSIALGAAGAGPGNAPCTSGSGGSDGGGGGAANSFGSAGTSCHGGGGGVGGVEGGLGGAGGFGGGGGGAGALNTGAGGGAGGFGGGGGGAVSFDLIDGEYINGLGGDAGFGGGGGGGTPPGSGGFGGGSGSGFFTGGAKPENASGAGGGGGLGAGGAVFVQGSGMVSFAGELTIIGNSVIAGPGGPGLNGGNPGQNGSAFGSGIFLNGSGASVSFAPAGGTTQSVQNVIADQHGSVEGNPNSRGVVKTGGGTTRLCAQNTYTGPTTVSDGTLEVCIGGSSITSEVTVNGTGTLRVGGTVYGNVVVESGGTLQIDSGGTVDGNVTVNPGGSIINNGTITGVLTLPDGEAVVSTGSALIDAITGGATTITFSGNMILPADTPAFLPGTTVSIDGSGFTLDGANQYRCFFVGAWEAGTANQASLSVTIENLILQNCKAQGGEGGDNGSASAGGGGGGGGGGLGGAIFVANQASLTLINVGLANNGAEGGDGGGTGGLYAGSGGGMGGNGLSGGGGGGLGVGAVTLSAGIATGAASGGGWPGCSGGIDGGGGCPVDILTGAGGGGVGGGSTVDLHGGSGGFGGGGGAAGNVFTSNGVGGNGGYGGGGGGAGGDNPAGAGGFGGGGGSGGSTGGPGGFGGGDGTTTDTGGGLGAGGAVFVQGTPGCGSVAFNGPLSITGSSVEAGLGSTGSGDGFAYGGGIFIQGDGCSITFSPSGGQTQTVSDEISDQTGSGGTGDEAGTGGLTKTGAGTLVLGAANSYSGSTLVEDGALIVTGSIQNSATMVNSGATLGGTGTTGEVSAGSGASIAPGESAGTLTTGDLLLDLAANLEFELDAPGTVGSGVNDLLVVNGDLTLDGTVDVTDLGGFGPGSYRLVNYTGALTDNGLEVGSLPGGLNASIDTGTPGQVDLEVVEPVSALVEPGILDFGGVPVGMGGGTLVISVTSVGGSPLSITSVQVTGAAAADYGLTTDTCSGEILDPPPPPPGEACTIEVTFTPLATGARLAAVSIESNAASSPDTVQLIGLGLAADTFLYDGFEGTSIEPPGSPDSGQDAL